MKEKDNLGVWPTPKDVGKFPEIITSEGFNKTISNPDNWEQIRNDPELMENWILPHAILLFGKTWFDRSKWSSSISRGLNIPLFSSSEKESARGCFEGTLAGRARISQICWKVRSTLNTYLQAKWYVGSSIKPVGGYIVESIKNDMLRELAKDNGYKIQFAPACPMCLTRGRKTIVHRHSDFEVSCDICEETSQNILTNVNKYFKEGNFTEAGKLYEQFVSINSFSHFSSIICNCPNKNCVGKFVPISCLADENNKSQLAGIMEKIARGGCASNIKLKCPFCKCKFISKEDSLVKFPTTSIWTNDSVSIDEEDLNGVMLKDKLTETKTEEIYDNISIQQKNKILIDELVLCLAKTSRKTVAGLLSWYFHLAVIQWIMSYSIDANAYFFDGEESERDMSEKEQEKYGKLLRKNTNVIRGHEASVHQTIFHFWMDLLEDNIEQFSILDSSITQLAHFGWFCRAPKFTGGPESTFVSVVDSKGVLGDSSDVHEMNSPISPRLARILSIQKDGCEYKDQIKRLEWHAIHLNDNCGLNVGDKVEISALLMSGHPTHAPIQRIIRLRSKTLQLVIEKIIQGEGGDNCPEYWLSREKNVKEAYDKISSLIKLGE
jgi:hypothetical protein